MSTVLIVDDARFMRDVLKKIVERNDSVTKIFEAVDGNSAIELFKKEKPDLVTLDINMPNGNGLTCLKELLKINYNAKVVMVTSVDQENVYEESKKLGAKGYIKKPFNRFEVLKIIEPFLN